MTIAPAFRPILPVVLGFCALALAAILFRYEPVSGPREAWTRVMDRWTGRVCLSLGPPNFERGGLACTQKEFLALVDAERDSSPPTEITTVEAPAMVPVMPATPTLAPGAAELLRGEKAGFTPAEMQKYKDEQSAHMRATGVPENKIAEYWGD